MTVWLRCMVAIAFVVTMLIGAPLRAEGQKEAVSKEKAEALANTLKDSVPQSLSNGQTADLIGGAEKFYRQGQLKNALKQLDRAQTEIRQQRLAYYRQLLPPVPAQWTEREKDENKGKSVGAAFLGGGSTIARTYAANGHEVSISFVVDSPMLTMFAGLAGALGGLAASSPGSMTVGGYRADYEEKAHDGKARHVLSVFADDVLVVVESGTLPRDTMEQFANLVDYARLKQVP